MDMHIHELPLFMMPESEVRLSYEDGLVLYDNLNSDTLTTHAQTRVEQEVSLPTQLKFNLMLFCHEGEIQLTVGLTDYEVHAGDAILFINDSIISRFRMSEDCRLAVICVSNRMGPDLVDARTIRIFMQHVYAGPIVVHLDQTYAETFIDQYRLMRRFITLPDFPLLQQALKGSFRILPALICSRLSEPDTRSLSRPEAIFRQFMEAVRTNYRSHRDIAYYADRLCLSPKHLGRTIRDYSGRRATDIIREHVILQAKTMLRSGRYTVAQIADTLNFPSASFFCRYFKSATGLTPLQY